MGSSSISLDFTKRTRIDRLSKVLITHIKINFTTGLDVGAIEWSILWL